MCKSGLVIGYAFVLMEEIGTLSAYLVKRECLGQRERPASFERSSDHGAAGGRRSTCQTEWMLKLETTHLDRYVDVVYWRVEQW